MLYFYFYISINLYIYLYIHIFTYILFIYKYFKNILEWSGRSENGYVHNLNGPNYFLWAIFV